MTTMRIAHVSDFHLRLNQPGSSGFNNRRSREINKLLPALLSDIKKHNVNFLALTGDLLDVPNYIMFRDDYYDYRQAQWHELIERDYRWFKQQLDAAGIPYMVLPGNHDFEPVLWRVFDRTENCAKINGHHLYRFCDREQDYHIPRRLDRERKLWESALADPAPQVHLQHYVITPEFNKGYPHTYEEGAVLAQKMSQHGNVRLALSGHYHAGSDLLKINRSYFATIPAFCIAPHPYRIFDIDGDVVNMRQFSLRPAPALSGRPVVFLDRDGVISKLASYTTGPEEMALIPGAGHAITQLHQAGYAVVVITSQSCIGYGYVMPDTVDAVHDRMNQLLAEEAASDLAVPDAIFYSTGGGHDACMPRYAHRNDTKPSINLLQQAVEQFQLTWDGAWMIGDRHTDFQTAQNARIRFALVRTGDGQLTEAKCRSENQEPDLVCDHLSDAVSAILGRPSSLS